jgi:hypothetical protein
MGHHRHGGGEKIPGDWHAEVFFFLVIEKDF